MDTQRIKKSIKDWAPYVIKYIVDFLVGVILFIKKQIFEALRQVFKG